MNTLYISSCVRDGGLYRCELTEEGALRLCGVIPADRPMYAVWQDEILYVLEREPDADTHESALRRFAVRPDGAYCELGTRQSTRGVCAPHLCVKDGAVYAVNYLSGSVCRIPDVVARHQGRSVHPTRQEAPHPHFITEAPDGVLLVTDLGLDRIVAYDAELNRIAETALRPGSGPRHLAFSLDGRIVFCVNELSSTVCMYRYDGAGRMTLLDEQSALPEDYAGESTAAAIRVDGEQVYVSNRGHDSIACLRAEGDALISDRFLPCHGTGPRDFDIIGDKIICTNETSDSVTVLDKQTGRLLSELRLPRPLCVTVLPQGRKQVEVAGSQAAGFRPVMMAEGCTIGMINGFSGISEQGQKKTERHRETDEVFIPIRGEAHLYIGLERKRVDLIPGNIYSVPKGVWHSFVSDEGGKVIVVEKKGTGPENSDYLMKEHAGKEGDKR